MHRNGGLHCRERIPYDARGSFGFCDVRMKGKHLVWYSENIPLKTAKSSVHSEISERLDLMPRIVYNLWQRAFIKIAFCR